MTDAFRRLSRRRVLAAGAAIVGTGGVTGCSFPVDSRRITRSSDRQFDPQGATAFTLRNHNGDVALTPGDGDTVAGTVTKRTNAGEDALDNVTVTETVDDGTLVVATEYDGPHSVSVDFDLSVPESLAVMQVGSENGDVDATGVAGDGTYRTTNGDVTVGDVDGYVTGISSNGDVDIESPAGLAGARSTNGEIDAEAPALREDARCETTNGDVTVAVPADLNAAVDLRTDNGDATVEDVTMTVEQADEDRIRGRLGDGGPTLELRSTNGDVTLTSL